ncbi:unnamed protein product [Owenia fusiformis]|uniref:Cytidine deaminase n=1 Tax=Owenia fusiformis TaxID=6347 RepID=A0A8J1UCJ7_OWEFU|nr:unnamed protein product [Owenia fusiformis]
MNDADLDALIPGLIKKARDAREKAYCPYSNFKVGAALLCEDGSIFTGCNVENASYGLCMCAERVSIANAVSAGHRQFTALILVCDVPYFIGSCGMCRQVMAEFGFDWYLVMTTPGINNDWKKVTIKELLPYGFGPISLDDSKGQKENIQSNE